MIDSGRTISEVVRELGIDAGMLSVWVKDERRRITAAEVHGDKPLEAVERAELLRLRRQVAELEKDNAFLVKASAYVCPEHFGAAVQRRSGSGAVREMEVGPPQSAVQAGAANHRELRRSRAGVVSVAETTSRRARQVWTAKASETEPLWKRRNA